VAVTPTIASTALSLQQGDSPLLMPTPTSDAGISIAPSSPVTAVIQTLFVDSTAIEEMSWQGDTLIANAAPDMPQNQVKFTPATILWQRNRMVLSDLQVGTQISFFGVDLGNIAYADYIVILAEPTQDFVKNGVYTSDHLGIGKIASIMPDPTGWSIKVVHNGNLVEIRTTQSTRVFRQQQTTLAALEVGSEVFYQGRLLQNGSEMLTEVAKAVILYVPSQYQAEDFPLMCTHKNETYHCRDEYLGIEFDHPASWGKGIGTLARSRYVGFSYNYRFENSAVVAGGRSNPFIEPRGGFLTDFSGSDGRPFEEHCASSDLMLCEAIQPGVELTILRSSVELLCSPGPGILWRPTAIITVDLPHHSVINGLLFATDFLSPDLTQELTTLAPKPDQTPSDNCDEVSRARFEEWMQRLTQQLHDNTVDDETQANLQVLRAIAASFRGEALRH